MLQAFGKQGLDFGFVQLRQRPARFLSALEDDEGRLVAPAVRTEEILLPVEIDAKRDSILVLLFLDQTFDDRKLLSASCSPVGVNGHQYRFSGFLGLGESRLLVGDPFRRKPGTRKHKNRQKDYGKHSPET